MALEALHPLDLTIRRLLNSSRVSIESPSQEILEFAHNGVQSAVEFLKFLAEFADSIGRKRMRALEGKIREAAWELEDALDSHVSDQFLSQSESESFVARDQVFSLDLHGVRQDMDGFTQKIKKMNRVFDPWFEEEDDDDGGGGNVSDIFGLSDQNRVRRTRFIDWHAMKAASIFLGMKEEYIQDLEKLLPEDEDEEGDCDGDGDGNDDDDDDDDDDLSRSDFSEAKSEFWYYKIIIRFISWLVHKATSIFVMEKEENIQRFGNLLQGDDDDQSRSYFTRSRSENRYQDIRFKLMSWWVDKAASIFVMENEEYTRQLDNPLSEDEEEKDDVVSPITEIGLNMSDMVGVTDMFCKIRNYLTDGRSERKVASVVGMAGIGKTALAKKMLVDPLISSKYECRIFVRLGPEYQFEKIMHAILAQLDLDADKMLVEGDRDIDVYLYKTFLVKKCLLVLDDVWNPRIWGELKRILPNEFCGSSVILTTRIQKVASSAGRICSVPFLNEKESWDLLRRKVFDQEVCPHKLEKFGKKIAENCEGLPLLIVIVAGLLSKAEKTPEYWSEVAANKTNSIFIGAYEQTLKVTYPSYIYLPQYLKSCFLYMGAFPQNCEARIAKLINLWSAEGFLSDSYQNLQFSLEKRFRDLVGYNLAMKTQQNSILYRLKACGLHSVFWYLSKRVAWNERFLHVLNSHADACVEDIESRRRLSVYKNIIFSIKEARDSIASIPTVRSLLCTGPYHQYQVLLCLELRLLKVLDALTIRFYEFPLDVLKLVQLRYLAFTCNGNLPPSISILWGLQCLIVHQHQNIKPSVSQSYLPVEIWDLEELEYLQIMGRNLPDPPRGAVLKNLLILLDVGVHTCTKCVLERIPNLEKLRVQIELVPGSAEPLSFCDDDISPLESLRSLQCVVVNPELTFETHLAPAPSDFTWRLKKLTLSGFGYPWEDMNKISELPYLEMLKLKSYAFRGEKWEVKEKGFRNLLQLSIEDTDLVKWICKCETFPLLMVLTLNSCYRLQEIPKLSQVHKIRLVDCNPSLVTSANQMSPCYCVVHVHSSW